MNNKPLEIQSLTFSTENGLKVDCRFDECGGRIVEMFPDAKSLDKVATVEQILADVDGGRPGTTSFWCSGCFEGLRS